MILFTPYGVYCSLSIMMVLINNIILFFIECMRIMDGQKLNFVNHLYSIYYYTFIPT